MRPRSSAGPREKVFSALPNHAHPNNRGTMPTAKCRSEREGTLHTPYSPLRYRYPFPSSARASGGVIRRSGTGRHRGDCASREVPARRGRTDDCPIRTLLSREEVPCFAHGMAPPRIQCRTSVRYRRNENGASNAPILGFESGSAQKVLPVITLRVLHEDRVDLWARPR